MNLFINDTPFFLIRSLDDAKPLKHKNILSGDEAKSLKNLSGAVVIIDVSTKRALSYLKELKDNHYEDVSFRIIPDEYNEAKSLIKREFKIIDAAGGVVTNKEDEKLLIYRLKKWDLPKGKLDKGEGFQLTAVREVEEETRVKVKLNHKITTTWHTYTIKDRPILKRTKWYAMDCLNDSEMKPQKSESIEKLSWMNDEEATIVLRKSYRSIRHVMEIYQNQQKKANSDNSEKQELKN